ncbi:MAG: hypothetical protein K8T89_14010 [Planctomycetes bacterium]|nr:hypothetical protein [Planctomycetota bacterium]
MIKINAKGKKFMMGSPKEEPNRLDNEEQHEVTFGHDFSMGKVLLLAGLDGLAAIRVRRVFRRRANA